MNRKERKARGIKGKKGDEAVINEAIDLARKLDVKHQHAEALKLYEKILAFDPDNPIALFDLAVDNIERGKIDIAESQLAKILQQDPKNSGALARMGGVRLDQGRRDEALKYAEKSLRTNPPHNVLVTLSTLYRNAGMLDKAKEILYRALKLQPDDFGLWYTVQTLTKYTEEDLSILEKLEKEKKDKLPLEHKIILDFTMGRACFDTGHTDKAFWHYAEGNLLKRATYKFDVGINEAYVDSIIRLFTEDTVKRLRGKGSVKSNQPVFVIGMPRSGSTLIDQILSSHPDVGSVGEAFFLGGAVPPFPNTDVPNLVRPGAPSVSRELLEKLDGPMLDGIATKYLGLMAPYAKAPRVVDKMLFNFNWLGVIRLAFPEAKIIHCMRDPVDLGLSIWQLLFSDDIPWAYDQKDIGRYYLAYAKLMDHWRKLFPGEFYEVRYEDVVADQEGQSRKLLEFCGLPWDDRVLKFHETTRQVKTASVTQVRKPIYKDSVKKWKKYEKHLKPMIEALGITD